MLWVLQGEEGDEGNGGQWPGWLQSKQVRTDELRVGGVKALW